jgi:hypothetical protein
MLERRGTRKRRHHLLVAGTGRAGTSFLVRYLTAIGLDTHLSRRGPDAWYDDEAQAGYEDFPEGEELGNLPYVVKNPLVYEFIDQLLAIPEVAIDGAIVPVRALKAAASSRVVLERRAMYEHYPWQALMERAFEQQSTSAPGGIVYSLDVMDTARLLAVGFHLLIERLVRADVPIVFLDFPRLVDDHDYLYDALGRYRPAHVGRDEARHAFERIADARLVRIERELAPGPISSDEALADGLDRAALLREIVRLRTEVRALSEDVKQRSAAPSTASHACERVDPKSRRGDGA